MARKALGILLLLLMVLLVIGATGCALVHQYKVGEQLSDAQAFELIKPIASRHGGRLANIRDMGDQELWKAFQIQLFTFITHEGFFSAFFGGHVIIRGEWAYMVPVNGKYRIRDIDSDGSMELVFFASDVTAFDIDEKNKLIEMTLSEQDKSNLRS